MFEKEMVTIVEQKTKFLASIWRSRKKIRHCRILALTDKIFQTIIKFKQNRFSARLRGNSF
ncbi:hypothetical protein [uncultured Oscillibacter sp.]|uniref:hypothetical protein n=1 Tax=uncultured Oscillibacter sp. TaxID=876091 RepID=UPI0025DB46FF|nr:hypothetical protein [uncultured Oscillibacter sp.]